MNHPVILLSMAGWGLLVMLGGIVVTERHPNYIKKQFWEIPDLDVRDFSLLRSVLHDACGFSWWEALKFLEPVFIENYRLYGKGMLRFVYTVRNGTTYWEGIMLNEKHVLKT